MTIVFGTNVLNTVYRQIASQFTTVADPGDISFAYGAAIGAALVGIGGLLLGARGGTASGAVGGLVGGLIVGALIGLLAAGLVRLAIDPGSRPMVVGILIWAAIGLIVGAFVGGRMGGGQGAVAGAGIGLVVGGLFGAFSAITFTWHVAIAIGLAVLLGRRARARRSLRGERRHRLRGAQGPVHPADHDRHDEGDHRMGSGTDAGAPVVTGPDRDARGRKPGGAGGGRGPRGRRGPAARGDDAAGRPEVLAAQAQARSRARGARRRARAARGGRARRRGRQGQDQAQPGQGGRAPPPASASSRSVGRRRSSVGPATRSSGARIRLPKSLLPDEVDKALRALGDDGTKVRGALERNFADYLERLGAGAEEAVRSLDGVLLPPAPDADPDPALRPPDHRRDARDGRQLRRAQLAKVRERRAAERIVAADSSPHDAAHAAHAADRRVAGRATARLAHGRVAEWQTRRP